jgi:MFS family permease
VLVIAIAVIGFLFDTYELLMLPVIGTGALSELLHVQASHESVRLWMGRLLWMSAVCGGVFGLAGGWMIDRFGRKRIMVASVLLYSLSPLAAAFSTELWQFVLFRCTTFVGVCVEMVAAVTWLAELFPEKRQRERVVAWSLAAASLGGLLVTVVDRELAVLLPKGGGIFTFDPEHTTWRYTLLSGLVPGLMILALAPFVPESRVWAEKKQTCQLLRPNFGELFAPHLRRTTIVTTILSACAYAAAFGALQLTPSQVIMAQPEIVAETAQAKKLMEQSNQILNEASNPEIYRNPEALRANTEKGLAAFDAYTAQNQRANKLRESRKSSIQFWQELGGLTGRILLALLVTFLPARLLLRIFVVPGILLFPITYTQLVTAEFTTFAIAIFFCGLLTVAQFSYLSEYLPRVFPLHLRGTGGSLASNVGGRMIGTMAALLNTELLAGLCGGGPPGVAKAAAVIGGSVYLIAFVTSFFLPKPEETI